LKAIGADGLSVRQAIHHTLNPSAPVYFKASNMSAEKYIKIEFGKIKSLRPEVSDDTEVIVYEDGMIMDADGLIFGCIKDFWDNPKQCPEKLRALSEQFGKGIMVDDEDVGALGDEDEEYEDGEESDEEPDWMSSEEDE